MVPEYQVNTRTPRGTPVQVKVWKVGGGTVGKSYNNELWAFVIRNRMRENVIFQGDDLKIPGETKHKDVPAAAMEWLH